MSVLKRVALIDDHEIVVQGFSQVFGELHDIEVVATSSTVDDYLERGISADLVVLDVRLADRSTPAENVARLRASGALVLAFSDGSDVSLVRSAAEGGAIGVVLKSETLDGLREAIQRALAGENLNPDGWASFFDDVAQPADAGLSTREREALALYAAGAKTALVAEQMGVSPATVVDYIRRARGKYQRVGRAASTKVELYQRAIEDGILDSPSASGAG
jgi:DNA-binding NarL/FixJ family response regulator